MTLPNFNNPHYRLAGYIATAIVTLAALPLIYAMVFHTDWQFKVNWNLFSSPFFSPLFVVGIIIALVNMGRSHYSYDTIIETTDLDTGKKKGTKVKTSSTKWAAAASHLLSVTSSSSP